MKQITKNSRIWILSIFSTSDSSSDVLMLSKVREIWTLLYKVYINKHERHLTIECVLNYMFRFSTVPYYERCHLHLTLCIMLTIHSEYLTGLIIRQWDFVSIELIQIARYDWPLLPSASFHSNSKQVDNQ